MDISNYRKCEDITTRQSLTNMRGVQGRQNLTNVWRENLLHMSQSMYIEDWYVGSASESDSDLGILENLSSPQARVRTKQIFGHLKLKPSYDGYDKQFTHVQLPMAGLMTIRYHKWFSYSHGDHCPLQTGPAASYLWGTPRTITRIGDFSKYNP